MSTKQQTEMALPGEGIPESDLGMAAKIVDLLQKITSLAVVGEFLKKKGLPFSAGSWKELYEKRLLPALKNREISIKELSLILSEAEEFGRSHIFLYFAAKKEVERFLLQEEIAKTAKRNGHHGVLTEVIVEERPEKPKLTEIREEDLNGQKAVTFKVVETRRENKFLGESVEGDTLLKRWQIQSVRAINVVRLHESGLVEVRIQSHMSSTKYAADIQRVWTIVKEFVSPKIFREFSLRKAKDRIWEHRNTLKEKVRFSDSTMRNNYGTTLIASTGKEEADLFEDSAATASLNQFVGHGAHCASSNIWFRAVEGQLNREIHVLLSGEINEFAVPANCTKAEYEYVLNELRAHSR